ncbi:nitrogen regulation protein NR(I) [Mesosutterella sp. OilRF-GAM-744-9]|uniref:DNA-binding transcriptional regulator NtrC n=1 Tax=Mesosutterella porci TaxID=2915351 RepID=A0ABS9MT66_9BURK|nr:nitrogen regulation protein NR(I) [Mesosutterella sp. oilRF-744-WT-GAM-9]MCG5031582.1 nitrogen regulation protein NR(I) [Mesosutterella sp. oilRF-744-WT-GAM-9]MCI6530055.1 nitrogen regulation protein NR(I) [Mesosutterella sp.]
MREVWIVDDDKSIRWVLEKALTKAGFDCRTFQDGSMALAALKTDLPGVLVSDIRMPGINGIDLLGKIKSEYPKLPVIITTAFSDLDSAVYAFQGGAFEYLPKPFDINKAVELVRRAMDESENQERGVSEPAAERTAPEPAGILIGQAPAMQEVFRAIGRLSQSSITVLITGQSGAGKEIVARALHRSSPRSHAPFIALNMAAIPRELMESELFGHEKGAFTGATSTRPGRFEQADGGTLFLDEIGDMPMDLQTRLLRVLSDGYFYRVGGHQPLHADVRIIAATNQNLEKRVAEGLFREDLYHRLNVIRIRLPALKDRAEDIPLLTRHFLAKTARELNTDVKRLTPQAQEALNRFPFPGNVRQLENLCRWITVMAPAQLVKVEDLPEEITKGINVIADQAASGAEPVAEKAESWEKALGEEVSHCLDANQPNIMDTLRMRFERVVIRCALDKTGGRRVDAAERLGLGRNTITRKIRELNLDK